jgi:hypothetical protein
MLANDSDTEFIPWSDPLNEDSLQAFFDHIASERVQGGISAEGEVLLIIDDPDLRNINTKLVQIMKDKRGLHITIWLSTQFFKMTSASGMTSTLRELFQHTIVFCNMSPEVGAMRNLGMGKFNFPQCFKKTSEVGGASMSCADSLNRNLQFYPADFQNKFVYQNGHEQRLFACFVQEFAENGSFKTHNHKNTIKPWPVHPQQKLVEQIRERGLAASEGRPAALVLVSPNGATSSPQGEIRDRLQDPFSSPCQGSDSTDTEEQQLLEEEAERQQAEREHEQEQLLQQRKEHKQEQLLQQRRKQEQEEHEQEQLQLLQQREKHEREQLLAREQKEQEHEREQLLARQQKEQEQEQLLQQAQRKSEVERERQTKQQEEELQKQQQQKQLKKQQFTQPHSDPLQWARNPEALPAWMFEDSQQNEEFDKLPWNNYTFECHPGLHPQGKSLLQLPDILTGLQDLGLTQEDLPVGSDHNYKSSVSAQERCKCKVCVIRTRVNQKLATTRGAESESFSDGVVVIKMFNHLIELLLGGCCDDFVRFASKEATRQELLESKTKAAEEENRNVIDAQQTAAEASFRDLKSTAHLIGQGYQKIEHELTRPQPEGDGDDIEETEKRVQKKLIQRPFMQKRKMLLAITSGGVKRKRKSKVALALLPSPPPLPLFELAATDLTAGALVVVQGGRTALKYQLGTIKKKKRKEEAWSVQLCKPRSGQCASKRKVLSELSMPWKTLGLTPEASMPEVKQAWTDGMRCTHPDKRARKQDGGGDNNSAFHLVMDAYTQFIGTFCT